MSKATSGRSRLHCPRDDASDFFRRLEGVRIGNVCVTCGRFPSAVTEQPANRGEADTVHDVLAR